VFGAGGGTNSYQEVEAADLIVLWGSNARETHPIFFHHVLAGVRRGAKLIVVDPRRTVTAQWADTWLGLDVGTDIALSNAIAHEILANGWEHAEFIGRATSGFAEYRDSVRATTPEWAQDITGIPADVIRSVARAYANADRAVICWTLGITEHHNAVDNVFALINLALLTGHVGRYGCGLNPLRGQNNVQGGGDMGAIPDRLPGFQSVEDDTLRAKFEAKWGVKLPPERGWRLNEMFEAIEHGELHTLYVIGENPVVSEADRHRAEKLLSSLDHLVVQDLTLTQTADFAHVVLPAAASWCEAEGTVTSSERKVQRVRKIVDPPGNARDDLQIVCDIARRLGHDLGDPTAQELWDELRTLSPMHAGMSYERLEKTGGLRWPCYDEQHPGEEFLHARLWENPVRGPRAPFHAVVQEPPVDARSPEFPLLLTTGRRLDSFNSGVQSGRYTSPLRRGESIDLSPEDAGALGLAEREMVKVSSRRGAVEVGVRIDPTLRPGLAFMTFHFDVATNFLTIEANDPKSGTAEFKATAIRVEKLAHAHAQGGD
jgi:predicted molibdopterin-dependent oxidoreductase YjgC